jgi:RimJ/RimL family protein N-acetyltransferase
MFESKTTHLYKLNSKNVFTIECKDVVLREFQMEDLDAIYNITLQPEIVEFLPDWKWPKEGIRKWLSEYIIKENQRCFEVFPNFPNANEYILRLGIILKETNEFIGWITSGLKEELPPPNREIGYAISKDYIGNGYATQAAKGLIKYLFENTNTDVLNATALTYNTSSNKVINKSGFKLLGTMKIEEQDYYYYKLSKSDWKHKDKED